MLIPKSKRDRERRRAGDNRVLSRRRPLTLSMIRKLHTGLGLPADVLVRPYPLTGRAAA